MIAGAHPILSCAEARQFEAARFAGDEAKEWAAMRHAGAAVGASVRLDFGEIGGFPEQGRVLVLVGKGHNGGDALIAARYILEAFPAATAEVWFAFGERAVRPLVARAWRELAEAAGERARRCERVPTAARGGFALCLDGVFGFQFRPPVDARIAEIFTAVNALPIRLRAAVDLPSGLGEGTAPGAPVFRADFTYATGCVKTPVLDPAHAAEVGRLRYLDLGFFGREAPAARRRVLTAAVLAPLAALRAAGSDKRSYGHVLIVGGSRRYPGAALLAVLAALRSGAGLVTAFVPESLAPAFAARAPEAMWVGWPETPEGGLALEGQHLLQARFERADALVIGPGLAREPETLALVQDVAATSPVPLVLDADALQPGIVRAARVPFVVTPHAGEFARIAGGSPLEEFTASTGATVVLKGPVTRIAVREGDGVTVHHSFFGGPVLARGGSGDLLAGMIGAQLAQHPDEPALAAARGVVWHGLAADRLAQAHGQVAVHTTQLLDFLPAVLRAP